MTRHRALILLYYIGIFHLSLLAYSFAPKSHLLYRMYKSIFFQRINPYLHLFNKRRSYSKASCHCDNFSSWPKYLIEFRDKEPHFRFEEVKDIAAALYGESLSNSLVFEQIIPWRKQFNQEGNITAPICSYVHLPNDTVAASITEKSSLIRAIIDVWGLGESIYDTVKDAERHYDDRIARHFIDYKSTARQASWRVNFRRYGRSGKSGLDYNEKRKRLFEFDNVFKRINGVVDLKSAGKRVFPLLLISFFIITFSLAKEHDLILLEDWHNFHDDVILPNNYTRSEKMKYTATNITRFLLSLAFIFFDQRKDLLKRVRRRV